jgi:hypothetical protein
MRLKARGEAPVATTGRQFSDASCLTCSILLVLAAAATALWIRLLPLALNGATPADRTQLTYADAHGGEHLYLGGDDSFYWVRLARTYLDTGTVCDTVVDGECRDLQGLAPAGRRVEYVHSLHVLTIAALHRLLAFIAPAQPLPASAFVASLIVGLLGVVPAFAIGRRLAGALGGLFAAVLVCANPLFIVRSAGADNDAWNVTLPLFMTWTVIAAMQASKPWRQAGWVAAAILVAGLHALTWKGWVLTYGVLFAALVTHAVTVVVGAARREERSIWRVGDVRRIATVLILYCVGAVSVGMVTVGGFGTVKTYVERSVKFVRAVPVERRLAASDLWPDPFTTVTEFTPEDFRGIADQMGGAPYFFAGWLGLMLLFLPRRDWAPPDFAMLIGGTCAYWCLLGVTSPSRGIVLAVLALPLVMALLRSVVSGDVVDHGLRGAGIVVSIWYLAALSLAFDGSRFAMLLVPPFGIACGVAAGRFYEWLLPFGRRLSAVPSSVYRATAFLVVCLFLVAPLRLAQRVVGGYLPRVNDAWWGTFTRIRDESPPQTIVTTWWPYGYWAAYAAQRRVTADGGTVRSHVSHWLARALFAPSEREAVGLLRMLDCGSDPSPLADEPVGAYQQLLAQGLDEVAAYDAVVELARRDRDGAEVYLRELGMGESTVTQISSSTHCDPPPAYLVLTDEMVGTDGWKYLGSWDVHRAYLVRQLGARPEAEIVRELVDRFRYPPDEALALAQRAAGVTDERSRRQFIAPHGGFLTPAWVPCHPAGADMVCPLSGRVDVRGGGMDAFIYHRDAPAAGRLGRRVRGLMTEEALAPAAVVIAGADRLEAVVPTDATPMLLGVLVDTVNARVLVGSPDMLRSTFAHLIFLDGRYSRALRKSDERIGFRGERVLAWRVDWGAL